MFTNISELTGVRLIMWRSIVLCVQVGSVHRGFSETPLIQEVSASMRGLIRMHSPSLLVTVNDLPSAVVDALKLATAQAATNTTLVQIPHTSFTHALWMATVPPASLTCKNAFSLPSSSNNDLNFAYVLPSLFLLVSDVLCGRLNCLNELSRPVWSKMRIQINIITQNRATSLMRLLQSLSNSHYVGDTINISFNMDSAVDSPTLNLIDSFDWPYGQKTVRRRIIQGGLIRAVSESW